MLSVSAAPVDSKPVRVIVQTIGALAVLFLILDGVTKLLRPIYVVEAFARESIPISLAPVIGTLLLVLLAAYLTPRTRVVGSILLTGYLGGAVAVNLRASDPLFEVFFPIIVGCLLWVPVYITNDRLRNAIAANQ